VADSALFREIEKLVPHGSRVLDLGCGDGTLLAHLQTHRGCRGYGIELNEAKVLACIQRGLNVIQFDLEAGLSIFDTKAFDVVLQVDTLSHLRNVEVVLRETVRVGKAGIAVLANFAHWPNRWSILRGRMPMTHLLPYHWYETPNIRFGTHASFLAFANRNGCVVDDHFGLHGDQVVRALANWRASKSVFKFRATEAEASFPRRPSNGPRLQTASD
jgi:methionine biosynthesis protein MetW